VRRHDFDLLSFLFGLLFAAVALVLLGGGTVGDGLALPWAGPLVAVGIGIVIVLAARPRAARPAAQAEIDSAPADEAQA
jgi:divalent metal cation (Fe/Co/Zn/Cd) transporter